MGDSWVGCVHCGTRDDVRPYGKGGALICFACMKADPEREAEATRRLGEIIRRHRGVLVICEDGPPREPTEEELCRIVQGELPPGISAVLMPETTHG